MLSLLLRRGCAAAFPRTCAAPRPSAAVQQRLFASPSQRKASANDDIDGDGGDGEKAGDASKPMSRWRRLFLQRKAAPTPANRLAHAFDRKAAHTLSGALAHVRAASWARFDESLELVFCLNVDPRRAEHNLRGVASLPHGTGVSGQIVAFVGDAAGEAAARAAGVDLAGGMELVDRVKADKGKCVKRFSVALATADVASDVAQKVGRVLGPKGLLPGAKTGTVVDDASGLAAAVAEWRRGRMRYRVDKFSSLHLVVGKLSFDDDKLVDNVHAAFQIVLDIRPVTVKKAYITKAVLCSSMGPSVLLDHKAVVADVRAMDRE